MIMTMKNTVQTLDGDPHDIELKNKKDGKDVSEDPRTEKSQVEDEDDGNEEHSLEVIEAQLIAILLMLN